MKISTLISSIPLLFALTFVTILSPVQAQSSTPAPLPTTEVMRPGESPYNYYMRLGYAAAQRDDYQTAALYFRNALFEKPRDREATIAYWNAVDVLKGGKKETQNTSPESAYDRYMRWGYDASERGAYQQALRRFQKALQERPGDQYATQAIRNVQTYIQRGQTSSGKLEAPQYPQHL